MGNSSEGKLWNLTRHIIEHSSNAAHNVIVHVLHHPMLSPEIKAAAIILFSERKDHCVVSCLNILKVRYHGYSNMQLTIGRGLKETIVPKP